MKPANRREFLSKTATVAAGASVLATPAIAANRLGANGRIRVGIIGLRGRGRSHMQAIHNLEKQNVELAAMCDVDESVLSERLSDYRKLSGNSPKAHTDLRRILDDPEIDAVTIATPNHWHTLATVWACQAGKDVYVEKPLSHNVHEGRKAVEAARKYKCIVQHGTQNRSSPNIIEGMRRLKEGLIGEVYLARGLAYKWRPPIGKDKPEAVPAGVNYDLWTGPAPKKPFSPLRFHRRTHWLWDYGNGELGNQGIHQLDMMRWGLGLDDHPRTIQSMGGKFIHDDDQETPNMQTASYRYKGRNLVLEFEIRPWITNTEAEIGGKWQTHGLCTGLIFYGSEGYLVFPHYTAYYSYLGKQKKPGPYAEDPTNKIANQPHFDNFIQAVRSREISDLNADVEEGHKSSVLAHLGNIAYRTGRTIRFDSKTETIVGDAGASKLLTRSYREPYVVPVKV